MALLGDLNDIEAWMRRRAERQGGGFAETPRLAYIQCANRIKLIIENHAHADAADKALDKLQSPVMPKGD